METYNIVYIGSDNFILPKPGMFVLNKGLIGLSDYIGIILKVKPESNNIYYLTILSFYVPAVVHYWIKSYQRIDFYGKPII